MIGAFVGCLSEPHWSPDGVRLTFSAHYVDVDEPRREYNGTFIIRADGTHLRPLASSMDASDSSTAWAPDGTRIAVGLGHIFTMDPHGGHRVDLTPRASGSTQPTWEPLCSARREPPATTICEAPGRETSSAAAGETTESRAVAGKTVCSADLGDDRIDARDGDYDVIGCGAGRDAVVGDRGDLVGRRL